MRERRKQERKSLMAYTQVFDLYGGFLLGYLGDLTLQGAMIISERAQQKDTEITLSIELPELPNMKSSRMALPARVVWCEQDLSPQFFNIGFEFKDVNEQQKALIESIIKEYEFRRDIPDYPRRPGMKS
ncbi:MAG: PilZ domain-containing protein [Anaerolineales bacterium]|nr:PilZ domain-containing protein [Anaerolineales bacterium]